MPDGGDVSRTATTFTVEQLVTRAWRGDIRVPHFQRAFRWKWSDAEKLFDSIVKNYPIGSLLLWARPAPARRLQLGALRIEAEASNAALWVVDGQQRITSLANALHPDAQSDSRFALAYNLRSERFTRPKGEDDPLIVPLPVLFDPQQVMQWFWERPEVKDYFTAASAITQKVRDYSVPAYRVEHNDERVLQDIFDRMNNYGKRLTKAEVFTALNAGDEDRAAEQLTFQTIATRVDEQRHFGELDEGTALQAVLARRHPDIQREIRNEFARNDREGRDAAYEAAEAALLRAVAFLQDEAGVPHAALLPFRYLLVVLARFFSCHPEPDTQNRKLLRRWYWRAAVVGPGIFPGGTTGATRILGQRIRSGEESGSVQDMLSTIGEEPAEPSVPDVQKFRANAASSKIVLCSWWAAEPRDPETGDVFDRTDLSESLVGQWTASEAVHTVVAPRQLSDETRSSAANRVLLPVLRHDPSEVADLLARNTKELPGDVWRDVQHSHLLTARLADLLTHERVDEFVTERQKIMHDTVTDFLQRSCEWGFEDTPPLSELVMGEDEDRADDDAY
jgi:hypothetical protein